MSTVLLGGGGLLGSGFVRALERAGEPYRRISLDWSEVRELGGALRQQLAPLLAGAAEPVTVVWAAGTGSVGASRSAMDAERIGVQALAEVVDDLPQALRRTLSIVLASSAGALHAGHGSGPIDSSSPPAPTSDYGFAKLAQEQLLEQLALSSGCRVVAARISNLYGSTHAGVTSRGLVATAVRATRLRQPMTVYVSSDVRRDYVYNDDAAVLCLRALAASPMGFSTALVCDGETRTVAEVLGVVGRVAGRRVPAVYAERPETRLQPPVLRFARLPADRGGGRRTPLEVGVHLMMRAPLVP